MSKSMRERMLAGEPYIADDPELAEKRSATLDLAAAPAQPITIEDDVWPGGGVIDFPGVTIDPDPDATGAVS